MWSTKQTSIIRDFKFKHLLFQILIYALHKSLKTVIRCVAVPLWTTPAKAPVLVAPIVFSNGTAPHPDRPSFCLSGQL